MCIDTISKIVRTLFIWLITVFMLFIPIVIHSITGLGLFGFVFLSISISNMLLFFSKYTVYYRLIYGICHKKCVESCF